MLQWDFKVRHSKGQKIVLHPAYWAHYRQYSVHGWKRKRICGVVPIRNRSMARGKKQPRQGENWKTWQSLNLTAWRRRLKAAQDGRAQGPGICPTVERRAEIETWIIETVTDDRNAKRLDGYIDDAVHSKYRFLRGSLVPGGQQLGFVESYGFFLVNVEHHYIV